MRSKIVDAVLLLVSCVQKTHTRIARYRRASRKATPVPEMTRDQYLEALRAAQYIKNPTEEQMLSVCPHLTREQAIGTLTASDGHIVALPPLKIRGSFRLAWYFPHFRHDGCDFETSFQGGQASKRTLESYADGMPHGDVFGDAPFMEQAMAYAEEHWPEELVLDDWVDYQLVHVQDPTDLVRGSLNPTPRTKFAIGLGLNRSWNDVHDDGSVPRVQQWDDAISITSLDPLVSEEFRGGRGGASSYNCARCGGGLGLTTCHGCKVSFPRDNYRQGGNTPLPAKLINLLRDNGHEFALNPERLLIS
jgi:hypothetical protein